MPATCEVAARHPGARLFMKAARPVHGGRLTADALGHLDVAVGCFRPCRLDPQGYECIDASRKAARRPQRPPQRRAAVYDVIGRHDGHDGVGLARCNPLRRQGDAGSGVAAHRLDEHVIRRKMRQLAAHLVGLLTVGYNQNAWPRESRQQAVGGLLQQRAPSCNRQQLLGQTPPAARPEARALAAGHYHGIAWQPRNLRRRGQHRHPPYDWQSLSENQLFSAPYRGGPATRLTCGGPPGGPSVPKLTPALTSASPAPRRATHRGTADGRFR